MILVSVISILTTIFTRVAMKALNIKSKCSDCCDIEIDTNND